MLPADLTRNVFDAAVLNNQVPNPILLVAQVQHSHDKMYFLLIDGGSYLDDDVNNIPYYIKGVTDIAGAPNIQTGDVIHLSAYEIIHAKKGEPALIIKMVDVLRSGNPAPKWSPYPYNGAKERLENISEQLHMNKKTERSSANRFQQQPGRDFSRPESTAARPPTSYLPPSRPPSDGRPFPNAFDQPIPAAKSIYPHLPSHPVSCVVCAHLHLSFNVHLSRSRRHPLLAHPG